MPARLYVDETQDGRRIARCRKVATGERMAALRKGAARERAHQAAALAAAMDKPSDPHDEPVPVGREVSVTLTDEELMLAYQRGDRDAFDELYARYARPIYNFLRRTADWPEAAEDLLQKTFLKLHAGRHQYRPIAPFRGWIFTLARNVLRDEARERRRRPAATDEPFDEDQLPARRTGERRGTDLALIVTEALAALPLTQREVIVLSRYYGMSYGEIGELLGISENAVKQRAFQAMVKLRRWLRGVKIREETP